MIHSLEGPGCKNLEIQNVEEVNSDFTLKKPLYQGHTGTCYAQSSYYLLNYLLSSNYGNLGRLSLVDFVAKGSGDQFLEGGSPYLVLSRLNGLRLAINRDLDLEKVFNFSRCFDHPRKLLGFEGCLKYLKEEVLPATAVNSLEEIISVAQSLAEQDYRGKSPSYLLLKEIYFKDEVVLPEYHVKIFDISGPLLSQVKSATGPITRERLLESEIEHLLSMKKPLILSYCKRTDETGICIAGHTVVITGTRRICCGSDQERRCNQDLKIVNSMRRDGSGDGWYQAEPIFRAAMDITYIESCDTSRGGCKGHVLGADYPAHWGTLREGLVVGPNLLISLAAAGDTESLFYFLEAKKSEFHIGDLTYGTSLLIEAVAHGHTQLAQRLIEAGALVNQADQRGYTPLMAAAQGGMASIVSMLISRGAETGRVNLEGKNALELARLHGHSEIVRLIQKASRWRLFKW